MSSELSWTIKDQELSLRSDKTIYWKQEKLLIVSDLHIGKVMHFRRSGFAIPLETAKDNLERLSYILLNSDIQKVIFLGDLYHSSENNETLLFWEMMQKFPQLEFILIKGNHDVHTAKHFEKKGLQVFEELNFGPFCFTHEPKEKRETLVNLAGHLHPAVKLRGKARSYLRLPCFFFNEWQGILPAFGAFTGLHTLSPQKGDYVFAIANEDKILDVSIP
jgi:DNA ligase-associated metallophosphoesterase